MNRRRFLQVLGGSAAWGVWGSSISRVLADVPHADAASARSGLTGPYGFLTPTVLGPQPAAQVRARIATMAREFGIREFQFYDWFADYSTPVRGAAWTDPYFRRQPISRRTLLISIDEVHRQGGRAWAYVQAVGAEEDDWERPGNGIWKLRDGKGNWYWHPPGAEKPRFPTYFANAAWAEHLVERWAPTVKQLEFDGIHWDTLGRIAGDYGAEREGIHAFLKTTQPRLRKWRLRQTMNFVDLAWWDRDVVRQYVEFPYAEVWSTKTAEQYFAEMDHPDMAGREGVYALYPSVAVPAGWSTTQVICHRHREGRNHRLHYLIVGDGDRHMKNEYWPITEPFTQAERECLKE